MSTSLGTEPYPETLPSTERGHRQEMAKRQWEISEEHFKEYRVRGFILEVSHAKKPGLEFA